MFVLPQAPRQALVAPFRRGGSKVWSSTQRHPLHSAAVARADHIRREVFFDPAWYRLYYPDVRHAGMDALAHYISFGAAEHRSPGPLFDAAAYTRAHHDVAASGVDPMLHFIMRGADEGRRFFVHAGALGALHSQRRTGAAAAVEPAIALPDASDAYRLFRLTDAWCPGSAAALERTLAACAHRPLLSILMPVYRPDLAYLRDAVASVAGQVYPNWQLCIADDATGSPELTDWLTQQAAADPRIVVTTRPIRGHISAATNSAAQMATGSFFLLLDQDDLLAPDGLGRCAIAIESDDDVDYVYSDSDKVDAQGGHYAPHFKPGFSPELLLGYMCAGQVVCVRAELWREVGGMRLGFEGSQDHDLALRVTERARRVVHVPVVLYHWRSAAGSTALDGNAKPYSFSAGLRAVRDALARRGCAAEVSRPDWAVANGNAAFELAFADDGPSVGIVIPMRDGLELIRTCVESLARTTYRNVRVLILDNGSSDAATLEWLASRPASGRIATRVLRLPNPPGQGFNFSRLVNAGVAALDTEFVLLLNNDTKVLAPQWLSVLMGYGQMPGVGAVGAMLLYPDGSVQHAGVYHSGRPPDYVGHRHRGGRPDAEELRLACNVSAVTAACMLVRISVFLTVGGFDTENLAVAYNDVDFCYRVRRAGLRIVFAPGAVLQHDEGATRGFVDNPAELRCLRDRYPDTVDPYLNPNIEVGARPVLRPRRSVLQLGSPPRLLVSTHNLNREGAPMALLEACGWLSRHGLAVLTVQSPQDGPLREDFVRAGIEVEVVTHPLAVAATAAAYEELAVRRGRRLKERGFNLVLCNTLLEFHTVDSAHEARIPSVWLIHENEGWQTHFAVLPAAIRKRALACFGHPYRVVFVSETSRNNYRELDFHHNAMVIRGGIAPLWAASIGVEARTLTRAALGAGPDDVLLLSVGTICARKRQADLLQAMATLETTTQAMLLLVGARHPPYYDELLQELSRLPEQLRARVHILPETDNVQPFYAAADVFVLSSSEESFPRVILEAMAAGLPIVTTSAGGVLEQLRPGVNASVYPAGDIARLATALAALCGDRALRARYAAASKHIHGTLSSADDFGRDLWGVLREGVGAGILPSRLAQM